VAVVSPPVNSRHEASCARLFEHDFVGLRVGLTALGMKEGDL